MTRTDRARAAARARGRQPRLITELRHVDEQPRDILARVARDSRIGQALWPALVLAALAFVVLDLVQHPFAGDTSEAAVGPQARWTLWLAETEAGNESGAVIREATDSLLLYGRPAGLRLLPGGSSRAVSAFFAHHGPPGRLLAISSETLAELAQARAGALFGEDPLQAAHAQALLARATPMGMLSEDRLAIAVSPGSSVRSASGLFAQMRSAPSSHVFAIANEGWAQDNLAALVRDAGVQGVVPYRAFPSTQDAVLALAAGSANVMLATRGAIAAEVRAHRLRELPWPPASGGAPRVWVELLAPPDESTTRIRALRRQLDGLSHNAVWRRLFAGELLAHPLAGRRLRGFLPAQMAQTAQLARLALRVEHD